MRADDFLAAAARLPVRPLGALVPPGRGLVVVAPHPDDESLGCGGLIAAARRAGAPVRLVIVSDGVGSHPNSAAYPPPRLRALREREARAAARILGLPRDAVRFLRLPDRHVPSTGPAATRAARTIAALAREVDAAVIAVTWAHDPHCDHAASAALARRAAALLPGRGSKPGPNRVRVHAYPVWGWTLPPEREVGPGPRGMRLAVASHLSAKRRAIRAHVSQTTGLIADDPEGFTLDEAMLARFERGAREIFLRTAP